MSFQGDLRDSSGVVTKLTDADIRIIAPPNKGNTLSGYGARIPMRYQVRYKNRWRRVYCCIFSNSGSCFIGKKLSHPNALSVDIWRL